MCRRSTVTGTDAPARVARIEFSDILHDAQVVLPLANWRGSYDRGYTLRTCYAYGSNGTFIAPPVDGTPTTADTATYPPGSGGYGGTQYHCVDVDWPGSYTYSALQYRRGYAGPDAWMGSLIFGSRDASGLYNRRNRYYDADKGRFTQEDPIGLAGGTNLYGFANGDPISYADPYGLWIDFKTPQAAALWNELAGRVNQGLRSRDPEVRSSAARLRDVMNDAFRIRGTSIRWTYMTTMRVLKNGLAVDPSTRLENRNT